MTIVCCRVIIYSTHQRSLHVQYLQLISVINTTYSSVDDIDLYVGGLAEITTTGSTVGPTFSCLIGEHFNQIKYSDRYFYELGGQSHSFSSDQLTEIRKASLARIFCDNSDGTVLSVQPQAFSPVSTTSKNNSVLLNHPNFSNIELAKPTNLTVDELMEKVSYGNSEQKLWSSSQILWPPVNETGFWPKGIVITIQVHNRISYLRKLLQSLSQARWIDRALLVFSHNIYSEELNDIIRSIPFAAVMQIYFPYSTQLYPSSFPGDSPSDCPRDIDKKRAIAIGCSNAETPDLYGHYREARYSQTKHHWWWKANFIFGKIRILKDYDGQVVFMEEDHYVAEDFLHILWHQQLLLKGGSECPFCNQARILSLGTYPKYFNHREASSMAGLYGNSLKVCGQITNPKLKGKVVKLEAAIKFAEDDLGAAQNSVNASFALSSNNDVDTLVNMGCIRFKEEDYLRALHKFQSAVHVSGFEPQLLYNVAVCHYKMKEYAPAIKSIADIIERGIRDHPELSVVEGAKEALTDMPPRLESELDPVTLHNMALLTADANPSESFDKLQFLLQQQIAQHQQQIENPDSGTTGAGPLVCPPETFANLLLLYCKYEYFDLAADLMAEHADMTYKHLSSYVFDFLEALITQQTSPEEAYAKFDALCVRYGEAVRRTGINLKEARRQQNSSAISSAALAHEQALETYLPVLMNQAKIYWDRENYVQVEKLFRQSAELCGDADVWRLNVAHTLFMQESKFREATSFYEPLVKQNYENVGPL
nr:EOG090X0302 [Megafenestra aurita]